MPGDEKVDVVNEHDVVTGSATIRKCLEKGLLHRAVAVLILRSDGKFLLQQRSKGDLWQPGLWTLSSTGHVGSGETYDHAASRELNEELGIVARLNRVERQLLPPIQSGGLTEREWVVSYVAQTDMPCTIDRNEVETVGEFDEQALRPMFDDGSMTPDAVILLTGYLDHRRQQSLRP